MEFWRLVAEVFVRECAISTAQAVRLTIRASRLSQVRYSHQQSLCRLHSPGAISSAVLPARTAIPSSSASNSAITLFDTETPSFQRKRPNVLFGSSGRALAVQKSGARPLSLRFTEGSGKKCEETCKKHGFHIASCL